MSDQLQTIDDIIIDGFKTARDALFELCGTTDMSDLVPLKKILASMRMMDDNMVENLAKPVILRFCQELGIDPKTDGGRRAMEAFDDNIALALQDGINIVMAQQQRTAHNAQALQQGRPNKLIGT